jgi:dethiobiotin synthetase
LILVGGSYLGTLSHILSAQDVVLRCGLDLRAIAVSESEGSPPPFHATLETLAHFAKAPVLGLRRQGRVAESFATFQRLAELIA